MKALKFLLPAGLFAVLIGFFVVGLQRDPSVIPSPLIGKPAPQFTLEDLQNPSAQVSLASYTGKPYMLNVWGTWCGGCREEHELLLEMARTGGIPIIGLNWKDDRGLALQWLQQLGNPYQAVAFDPAGKAAIDWGVYGAPETFLVGRDGTVIYKQIGIMTREAWVNEFLPRITQELAR